MTVFSNNRDLLDRFRGGDRGALTRVYTHYVNDVEKLVRRGFSLEAHGAFVRGVREPGEQCVCVQEVFVRAFQEKARQSYDGLSPYRPFLLRIAKNIMIDRYRRKKPEVSLEGEAAKQENGVGDIEQVIARNAPFPGEKEEVDPGWQRMLAITQTWVQSLDEESRQFVRLRFEEEMSQYDVAEKMGITRRRVRTLEERVQAGLKKHLEGRGIKVSSEMIAGVLLLLSGAPF